MIGARVPEVHLRVDDARDEVLAGAIDNLFVRLCYNLSYLRDPPFGQEYVRDDCFPFVYDG
jgi:hypothetical protein